MYRKLVISTAVIVLCFSCATDQYRQVDNAVSSGRYDHAAEIIEESKKDIYRDAVLYYLDKGILEHFAGNYNDSIDLLQNGEEAIYDAFTKSVTQELASFILNDNTKDYSGEDYEDIYLNAFNALNYYHKDDIAESLVEIRRMNEKLEYLATKYDQLTTSLEQEAIQNGEAIPTGSAPSSHFANSALARYLGMLFYRADGKKDDARIDYEQLKMAFIQAPEVYTTPAPSSIDEELDIPVGKARLNVLCFAGLSPVKEERTERISLSNTYIKITLPFIQERSSEVSRVSLVFNAGQTITLDLLENISSVAQATFAEKVPLIYIKTILRTVTKSAVSGVLDKEGYSEASKLMQFFTEVSEQADTRLSRYFPSKAYIGGITLEPGVYSFSINYYASNGRLIQSEKKTMDIQAHKLNLVEAICLK